MALITFTNDKPRFVKVMSTFVKGMGYELWKKVLRKVFGFFCDVKTRICETLALRKDFRMIVVGTKMINAPALFFSVETTQRWSDIRTMKPHVFSVFP
jgi:hypothetical protein